MRYAGPIPDGTSGGAFFKGHEEVQPGASNLEPKDHDTGINFSVSSPSPIMLAFA